MTHAAPTSITLRKTDNPRMVEISFFGPTWLGAASAIYPREEVVDWISQWLGPPSLAAVPTHRESLSG